MNDKKNLDDSGLVSVSPLFLWTGPRHAGKTSRLVKLESSARGQGLYIAGVLSLSIYSQGNLVGFDLLDITTRQKQPLARRNLMPQQTEKFDFEYDTFRWGNTILTRTDTQKAHLIIIDEFGPLEMRGLGWRPAIDQLIESTKTPLLVVVRDSMVSAVRKLFLSRFVVAVPFDLPDAILQVINAIKHYHGARANQNCRDWKRGRSQFFGNLGTIT